MMNWAWPALPFSRRMSNSSSWALGREGCFRFVEEVDSAQFVAGTEIGHDGLAVGLGDQGLTAEVLQLGGICSGPTVDDVAEVVEDLRAEVGSWHSSVRPLHGDVFVQFLLVAVATVGWFLFSPDVNVAGEGQGFQERGLSCAVLSDEEGDREVELYLPRLIEDWQGEGVAI